MMRLQSLVPPRHQYKLVGAENPREIPLVRTNKKSVRKICRSLDHEEFPTSLLRFGPVYYEEDSWESAKEEAWNQVLRKSPDEDAETIDAYLSAITAVEKKARAAYTGETLDRFTEPHLRCLMMKDGCFFLQLVLFILGASKELGYPENHIIFGEKQGKKKYYGWIKSMFYAGNQIPLVVLNELMKQAFFQNVIKDHGIWDKPMDDLSFKGILFHLLILPTIAYPNSEALGSTYLSEEQPSDLLYGLQTKVLGPEASRNDSEDEEDEEEGYDLEAGVNLDTVEAVDNNSKELCVSGLRKKGIHFWKSNEDGISGIRFKNRMLYPGLYLPTIKLNRDTQMIFKILKYYEECQQQKEVRSYLGLMKELISTYEDVNHLASKGIFEASEPHYKENFLRMLKELRLQETATNHNHRYVLQQLRDYSSFPWEYFKYVAIFAFILSVLQTLFGVLSYVVGVKH